MVFQKGHAGYWKGKMYNKKYMLGIVVLLFMVNFVSAVPPIAVEFIGDIGLNVQANVQQYYKINEGAEIHIFVFNKSNGNIISGGDVDCNIELTDRNGSKILTGTASAEDNHFHISRNDSIVTERGVYALTIYCNASDIAGYKTAFFEANEYGRGLTEEVSFNFNLSLVFLMILFISSLIGAIITKQYITKLTLYWICHILFIVGTFSLWQFNEGFSIAYLGIAGIYKILFYVSIIAVVPMMILSVSWIVYIHTYNEHFQKLIGKGYDTEEAFRITNKKKGWLNGN